MQTPPSSLAAFAYLGESGVCIFGREFGRSGPHGD